MNTLREDVKSIEVKEMEMKEMRRKCTKLNERGRREMTQERTSNEGGRERKRRNKGMKE